MSCDVDSGARDIRLGSSRLFYLRKFGVEVQTKCRQGAFCVDHEAKFTVVKQVKWVKPEVARSWIYVTTLSMSILWSAARVDRKKMIFFSSYGRIK